MEFVQNNLNASPIYNSAPAIDTAKAQEEIKTPQPQKSEENTTVSNTQSNTSGQT